MHKVELNGGPYGARRTLGARRRSFCHKALGEELSVATQKIVVKMFLSLTPKTGRDWKPVGQGPGARVASARRAAKLEFSRRHADISCAGGSKLERDIVPGGAAVALRRVMSPDCNITALHHPLPSPGLSYQAGTGSTRRHISYRRALAHFRRAA
jgi:hypothetical protein